MSTETQSRVRAFLKRPIPASLGYVSDSMAERLLATYAKRGSLPHDPETVEMLELVRLESTAAAEECPAPEAAD